MRHSWVRFLGSLVVVFGLVGPASAADWSAYIDHDAKKTSVAQQQQAPAKRAKVSKRSTKKVAKAKAKAKAKMKARSKSKARRK